MSQSHGLSMLEAMTNVVVGYGVAVWAQILVFPVVGLQSTLGQNLQIGVAFTLVSLARSYLLRRVFDALDDGGAPHG